MDKRLFKPLMWQFFIEPLGEVNDRISGSKRARLAMYYLPKEQALTVVHTLRRIMLSNLLGIAITGIEWLPNITELSQVNGIKESVTEILFAFQSLRFQSTTLFQAPIKIRLIFFGPGNIYGRHLQLPKFIKLLNPDMFIMHVTTVSVVDINCYIEQGVGFVNQMEELTHNRNHFLLQKQSFFPLNTNFNPIIEANYLLQERIIEKVRFHDNMYLVLWDITTNGTIDPYTALLNASNKASKVFQNVSLALSFNFEITVESKNVPSISSSDIVEVLDEDKIFLPIFILQKIQKYKIISASFQQPSRRQNPIKNVLLLKSRQLLRKLVPLIITRCNDSRNEQ